MDRAYRSGAARIRAREMRACVMAFVVCAGVFWLWAGQGAGEVSAQEGVATSVVPRFAHDKHLDKVRNCTGCHSLDKRTWEQRGKVARNHAPCNTSVCHGEEWKKPPGEFCLTCHEKNLSVRYPPYRARGASDWVLPSFSHTEHIEEAGGGNKSCTSCHATLRVRKPRKGSDALPAPDMGQAGHKACARCHAKGQAPIMSDCTGCHKMREGDVAPRASAVWNNYKVTYAFRHKDHKKKSRQNDCVSCHKNVNTQPGEAVPLPAMINCETCHNGQVAFNTRGTECRRCHLVPESAW